MDATAKARLVAAAFTITGISPAAADWRLPPQGYAFQPAAGCATTAKRPNEIYDSCGDQMQLFMRARAEAFGAKKQLLVIFGANWCPSCRGLKAALTNRDVMERPVKNNRLADRVHVVEIAVSTLHQGKVTTVPSGEAVLRGILETRQDLKLRAIPFLAVIDPVTGKASARNLDDLDTPQGWNLPALATVIAEADLETRGGPKAPGEPGWFKRKWLRWFGP